MPNVTEFPRRPQAPGVLSKLIPQWIGVLRAREYSPHTCAAYQRDLQEFETYLSTFDITLVQLIGTSEINRWLEERAVHFENSARSVARKFSTIKSFLAWCRGHEFIRHDPCRDVAVHFRMEPVIAPQLPVLLKLIESIPVNHPLGIRDRALFRLMFDSACRVGQICSLNLPDPANPRQSEIDVEHLQVRFRRKGGGIHVAGFDEATRTAINRYLRVRHKFLPAGSEESALFVSGQGQRMSRQAVHYRLKMYAAQNNLVDMTSHKFRHRRAGEVIRRLGLEAGQQLLGHRSKGTTAAIYGAEAGEVVRAQIREACALGGRG